MTASLDVEVISLSLLTELREFSSGRVTFDSISDALAPGIGCIDNNKRQVPSPDKDPPVVVSGNRYP